MKSSTSKKFKRKYFFDKNYFHMAQVYQNAVNKFMIGRNVRERHAFK